MQQHADREREIIHSRFVHARVLQSNDILVLLIRCFIRDMICEELLTKMPQVEIRAVVALPVHEAANFYGLIRL